MSAVLADTRPAPAPDVADVLNAGLHLSNWCLATAAWLSQERLPDSARLYAELSEEHVARGHQVARLCGRRHRPAGVREVAAPAASHDDPVRAADALLHLERAALTALEQATVAAAATDRQLAAGLAEAVAGQHRLVRFATALREAAADSGTDRARLERWARKAQRRLRSQAARRDAPTDAPPTTSVIRPTRRNR